MNNDRLMKINCMHEDSANDGPDFDEIYSDLVYLLAVLIWEAIPAENRTEFVKETGDKMMAAFEYIEKLNTIRLGCKE